MRQDNSLNQRCWECKYVDHPQAETLAAQVIGELARVRLAVGECFRKAALSPGNSGLYDYDHATDFGQGGPSVALATPKE